MPRNMSFMLTTEQIRNRRKTVTRRLGWWFLSPGDELNAVEKAQGLKPGERIKRLAKIRVVACGPQRLDALLRPCLMRNDEWAANEVLAEGFLGMTPAEFVEMFCLNMKCDPSTEINRVEFEYIDPPSPQERA